jgi:hypothetical protein
MLCLGNGKFWSKISSACDTDENLDARRNFSITSVSLRSTATPAMQEVLIRVLTARPKYDSARIKRLTRTEHLSILPPIWLVRVNGKIRLAILTRVNPFCPNVDHTEANGTLTMRTRDTRAASMICQCLFVMERYSAIGRLGVP